VTQALASVSADDVRDVINVTSEEIPDDKISKMIKRAQITVELETDKSVDCSDAEKEAITVLSAVYSVCYLTGGSAVGLSFSVGDQNVSVPDNAPPMTVLQAELERILSKLKGSTLRRAYKDENSSAAILQFHHGLCAVLLCYPGNWR
jgi:hypothetical protein